MTKKITDGHGFLVEDYIRVYAELPEGNLRPLLGVLQKA